MSMSFGVIAIAIAALAVIGLIVAAIIAMVASGNRRGGE
jgi:hypothetical protein